jgi:hypothetical protein
MRTAPRRAPRQREEGAMTVSVWWLVVAVVLGPMAGILLFAMASVAQDADREEGPVHVRPGDPAVDEGLGTTSM